MDYPPGRNGTWMYWWDKEVICTPDQAESYPVGAQIVERVRPLLGEALLKSKARCDYCSSPLEHHLLQAAMFAAFPVLSSLPQADRYYVERRNACRFNGCFPPCMGEAPKWSSQAYSLNGTRLDVNRGDRIDETVVLVEAEMAGLINHASATITVIW